MAPNVIEDHLKRSTNAQLRSTPPPPIEFQTSTEAVSGEHRTRVNPKAP